MESKMTSYEDYKQKILQLADQAEVSQVTMARQFRTLADILESVVDPGQAEKAIRDEYKGSGDRFFLRHAN
jgi:hypothetical protein